MKIQILVVGMAVSMCCAMEESFESGDLQRLFDDKIVECRAELQTRSGVIHDEIDTRCDQSYEQRCLCRACLGLCITNSLYTMGRITPSEQYPVIRPILGKPEPDPYVEHGLTCFAAICTIWTMSSGSADHWWIGGQCQRFVDNLARQGAFNDQPIIRTAPHPVFMPIAEKKDN